MKKTIVCINAVWAWTLFLTPSSAQTFPNSSISHQALRDQAAEVAPIYSGDMQRSQPNANCPSGHPPQTSTSPTDSVTLPATHKKISPGPAVWQDLRSHHLSRPTSPASSETTDGAGQSTKHRHHYPAVPTTQPAIMEAQGWTRDQQGRILLTSQVSTKPVYKTNPSTISC